MRRACCVTTYLYIAALFVAPAPALAENPVAKRELALELLEVAGGGDMARQFLDSMAASMQANHSSLVEQLIASQPTLTTEEEQLIRRHLADRERFRTEFTSRLAQRIDFDQILAEVYAPLYEQNFSEDELRQILEFQNSPVGRKAVSLLPKLLQEGMAATIPRLQPIIMGVATEVLSEQQSIALRQSQ
jgi:hypothetical protein